MRGMRPVSSPTIGSSSPALISGWALKVCSIIVVPERGKPTMKIGWATSDRTPARGRTLEPRRDEEGLEAPDQRRRLLGQIALAGQRAQSSLGFAERGEGLRMAADPVEQETLFAAFDRPEAGSLAPLFDVVERGQRLIVVLDASVQDRAAQQGARVSG